VSDGGRQGDGCVFLKGKVLGSKVQGFRGSGFKGWWNHCALSKYMSDEALVWHMMKNSIGGLKKLCRVGKARPTKK
jgi:hypothetical protein